jgi:hypothetical protein
VSFVIDLQEMTGGKLGITLGGGEAFVAQKFLDGAQIRTFLEQMCTKRMTQSVGVNVGWKATGDCNPFHDTAHTARSEALAIAQIDEQRATVQLMP